MMSFKTVVILVSLICSVYTQQNFFGATQQTNGITRQNAARSVPQVVGSINGIIGAIQQNTNNRRSPAFNLIGLCNLTKALFAKHSIVENNLEKSVRKALVSLKAAINANISAKNRNYPRKKTIGKCLKVAINAYN